MRSKYLYLSGLLILLSCNRFDGPSQEILKNYSFSTTGAGQKCFSGEYFRDSIGVFLGNYSGVDADSSFTAVFTVVAGGGEVDKSEIRLVNGHALTKWKSGEYSCNQRVKIDIISKNSQLFNSIYIDAFAFRKGVWDTITTAPDNRIADLIADTLTGKTWMITGSGLFTQQDSYFDWVQYSMQINPFSLHIDSAGIMYMSTWQGQIFKSMNSGINWIRITDPIPGHPYYYFLTVSNDGYIWATTPEYSQSLRCSRDGGQTWTADTIGLYQAELLGDIFRLGNGDILFHSLNLHLYKSADDGKSWITMQCPEYSTRLFVTDNEEIIIFNQDFGVSIYKSTDLGQSFRKVYSVMPEYGTIMSKIIRKKDNYYYILIPGFGIIRTMDFEDFDTFYRNTAIVYLYLTHDGVLITRGFDNSTVYYYKEEM